MGTKRPSHGSIVQNPVHDASCRTDARLLESDSDPVSVQRLMGHSDLDTTRQYLDSDEKLKRSAVSRLSLSVSAGT